MHDQGIAAYAASSSRESHLVEAYAQLVQRIAHHLVARLPDSVQVDDLVQAGMLGLLEAAGKYDGSRGASFETYAGIRIRGAMLDEVRRGDWVPRSVHRNTRRMSEAIRCVESRTGREAQDKDIAEAMGVSLAEYHRMLKDASASRLFSYEALTEIDQDQELAGGEGVDSGFESQAFRQQLANAIAGLPEREQLVLSLYYDEELNLKEIGAVIGVSESRVSQIMSQATLRLRARLDEWIREA
jgi:RNA polymerase sigma factor for flagellar operon FliA